MPTGPGLGVEIDEQALAQAATRAHLPSQDFVGILHLPGGHKAYSLGGPDVDGLTGTEEGRIEGINYEYWVDDGSEDYARVRKRLEAQGPLSDK